jgi:hypothetical protein
VNVESIEWATSDSLSQKDKLNGKSCKDEEDNEEDKASKKAKKGK